MQRVKRSNGTYGYVQVDENNKPVEFDENTGKFRIYNTPDGTGDYTWGWKNTDTGDTSGYMGPTITVTGNPNRKVGIQREQDDHWAALDRDKKVDEQVNQTVGSADNFTPWGLGGQAINYGFSKVLEQLPEEAQNAISYGRYMSPAYWSDRIAGKSDKEIMNGQSNLFGTGTGTMMDLFTGSTLLKPAKQVAKPVAKAVAEPFYEASKNLYDKVAPHTNVKVTLPDGSSYRQLTPKSKLVRDIVFSPRAVYNARQAGQYPLTFAERRKYLSDLHNTVSDVKDRLVERRTQDLQQMYPAMERDIARDKMSNSIENEPLEYQNIDFSSAEGDIYTRNHKALGYNRNGGSKINTVIRHRNSLLPAQTLDDIKGTIAHEFDHSIQNRVYDYGSEIETYAPKEERALWAPERQYSIKVNPDSWVAKDFAPITKNTGSWFGSPTEVLSEMQSAYESMGLNNQFRNLGHMDRAKLSHFINDRFGIGNYKTTYNMLESLSNKGYFQKGGKL